MPTTAWQSCPPLCTHHRAALITCFNQELRFLSSVFLPLGSACAASRTVCELRERMIEQPCSQQGFYDGEVTPFLSRAQSRTNQMAKGVDERVNPRELDLPPPGQ